ncbi:hypothetical protein MFUR16E_09490 [Methylobacterium fujisawaense]
MSWRNGGRGAGPARGRGSAPRRGPERSRPGGWVQGRGAVGETIGRAHPARPRPGTAPIARSAPTHLPAAGSRPVRPCVFIVPARPSA